MTEVFVQGSLVGSAYRSRSDKGKWAFPQEVVVQDNVHNLVSHSGLVLLPQYNSSGLC